MKRPEPAIHLTAPRRDFSRLFRTNLVDPAFLIRLNLTDLFANGERWSSETNTTGRAAQAAAQSNVLTFGRLEPCFRLVLAWD